MADLKIENHGSIFILHGVSELGQEWLTDNIGEYAHTWGGGVVVEHRFIADIAQGAMEDGLEVQ